MPLRIAIDRELKLLTIFTYVQIGNSPQPDSLPQIAHAFGRSVIKPWTELAHAR